MLGFFDNLCSILLSVIKFFVKSSIYGWYVFNIVLMLVVDVVSGKYLLMKYVVVNIFCFFFVIVVLLVFFICESLWKNRGIFVYCLCVLFEWNSLWILILFLLFFFLVVVFVFFLSIFWNYFINVNFFLNWIFMFFFWNIVDGEIVLFFFVCRNVWILKLFFFELFFKFKIIVLLLFILLG